MYKLKLSKDGGKRGFHSTPEEEEEGSGADEEEGQGSWVASSAAQISSYSP